MNRYPHDRPGEPPVIESVEELYGINPNIVKIQLPKEDFAFAFGMRPMAFHPHNGDDYGFTFRAGDGFDDSLKAWDFHHLQRAYWHVWLPPDQDTPEIALASMEALITDRYPKAASRASRAAQLVLAGKVRPAPEAALEHEYVVDSQYTKGRMYQVYIDPHNRQNWHCMIINDEDRDKEHTPCPDLMFAPFLKNGRRCKHMLAAWMFTRLQKKEASATPSMAVEGAEASLRKPDIYSTPEQEQVKLRAEGCQTHPESSDLFQQFDLSQPDPALYKRR